MINMVFKDTKIVLDFRMLDFDEIFGIFLYILKSVKIYEILKQCCVLHTYRMKTSQKISFYESCFTKIIILLKYLQIFIYLVSRILQNVLSDKICTAYRTYMF